MQILLAVVVLFATACAGYWLGARERQGTVDAMRDTIEDQREHVRVLEDAVGMWRDRAEHRAGLLNAVHGLREEILNGHSRHADLIELDAERQARLS